MSTLMTTGQFTITDHNDAVSIYSFIDASKNNSQVFTLGDGDNIYNPDWSVSPYQVLTAYVYAGSTTNIADSINGTWRIDAPDGTEITTGGIYTVSNNILTINNNMLTTTDAIKNYYFVGTYTDVFTGFQTGVIASITFSLVQKGESAIYVLVSGEDVIVRSQDDVGATAEISSALYRGDGVEDITAVAYNWQKYNTSTSNWDNLISSMTAFSFKNSSGGSVTVSSEWTSNASTVVIREDGVTGVTMFRARIKDTNNDTIYTRTFIVRDVGDIYRIELASSGGDKLVNGVGSTNIEAFVYSNESVGPITITSWTVLWSLLDKNGNAYGMINNNDTNDYGISDVTSNTFTTVGNFTTGPAAGSFIKVYNPSGTSIRFYEVESSTTTSVTVRLPPENDAPWLSTVAPTDDFEGGKLFKAVENVTTTTTHVITITGNDIDTKGTIIAAASKPDISS